MPRKPQKPKIPLPAAPAKKPRQELTVPSFSGEANLPFFSPENARTILSNSGFVFGHVGRYGIGVLKMRQWLEACAGQKKQ